MMKVNVNDFVPVRRSVTVKGKDGSSIRKSFYGKVLKIDNRKGEEDFAYLIRQSDGTIGWYARSFITKIETGKNYANLFKGSRNFWNRRQNRKPAKKSK